MHSTVARRLPPPGPQLALHRTPCLRPLAVRDGLQPAGQLRHVPRHEHGQDVQSAHPPTPCPPQSLQSRAPLHAACPAVGRRLSPPGPQLAPHRVPCFCNPRQVAKAFNHPLNWNTSSVTNMATMFYVRASPLPYTAPQSAVTPLLCLPCTQLAPHRMPCLRPSAASEPVQPAARLRHVPRHEHVPHVRSAHLPAPCAPNLQSCPPLHAARTAIARRLPPPGPQLAPHRVRPACDPRQGAYTFNQPVSFDTSSVTNMDWIFEVRAFPCAASQPAVTPTLLHAACTAIAPVYPREAARASPLSPACSVRLGRTQTACPSPTCCSSLARGRTPPFRVDGLSRDFRGSPQAAAEARTEVCVRPGQSLWRLPGLARSAGGRQEDGERT